MRSPHAPAGSSPRVRGARRRLAAASPSRIIPARAGSTRTAVRARASTRDHPRACGEHSADLGDAVSTRDHPRACGEHARGTSASCRASGIIPARAGSTPVDAAQPPRSRIIPARAGSTRIAAACCAGDDGSSPRVRGARLGLARRGTGGDHPRACGEHVSFRAAAMAVRGIIPARAGSTLADQRLYTRSPHFCMTLLLRGRCTCPVPPTALRALMQRRLVPGAQGVQVGPAQGVVIQSQAACGTAPRHSAAGSLPPAR